MRKLIFLVVIGLITEFAVDTALNPGRRADLNVQAALLLAHVLPTFWIPFKGFDKKCERWQVFVYTNAGPAGFGLFIGSLLRTMTLPATAQETPVASTFILAILAMTVALGYWSNRIMSRGFNFDVFKESETDSSIKELVLWLRLNQEGERADRLIASTMSRRLTEEELLKIRNLVHDGPLPEIGEIEKLLTS